MVGRRQKMGKYKNKYQSPKVNTKVGLDKFAKSNGVDLKRF